MNTYKIKRPLLYKINLAQRLLMKHVDRQLKERADVSATQAAALIYLSQNQGSSLADLSRELLQNKSAITTLVARMEKNGLINKNPSQIDKRSSQIYVTEKGLNANNHALSEVEEYNFAISKNFSDIELEVIDRFFDSIISNYEANSENFFSNTLE